MSRMLRCVSSLAIVSASLVGGCPLGDVAIPVGTGQSLDDLLAMSCADLIELREQRFIADAREDCGEVVTAPEYVEIGGQMIDVADSVDMSMIHLAMSINGCEFPDLRYDCGETE